MSKQIGPTKPQVETLLKALEENAGMTVKDLDAATNILGAAMALSETAARMEEIDSATHIVSNGDIVNGHEFFGPFPSEDDAFTFAQNQFHLAKRWKVVELKKPLDR